MEFTNPYKVSRNYVELFELISDGHEMPCYVDYSFPPRRHQEEKIYRDICRARRRCSFDISFGARGICYGDISSWHKENGFREVDVFVDLYKSLNVEFIEV